MNVDLLAMLVNVRSSATSVERLGTKRGTARKRVLPRVLPSGHVMIVVSKVIQGTDAQRRSSKRKLEKFVTKLMQLRMLSRKVRMWLQKKTKEKRLEDVPVIHDFPEAAPVVHAPYRLEPSKMRDLSKQLQELLEKGFIHPSSSPWEHRLESVFKDQSAIKISPASH
ncbi:hypothetical protein Tco_0026201 [Tanacetum coccineum]